MDANERIEIAETAYRDARKAKDVDFLRGRLNVVKRHCLAVIKAAKVDSEAHELLARAMALKAASLRLWR